jgi:hypothetical protein
MTSCFWPFSAGRQSSLQRLLGGFCLLRATEIDPKSTVSRISRYLYRTVPKLSLLASTLTFATIPLAYLANEEYQMFGGMICFEK